ncbi:MULTISPECIES: chorismate--pyruvate lyase family protein [unclassified Moraxella]|uniref:chorismate--pyruvate lyase family protein n=1 Tax=unclassified Moraxella TaxID=2685852 RepID=UPI003AF7CD95
MGRLPTPFLSLTAMDCHAHANLQQILPVLRPWLMAQGSLTAKIEALTGERLTVRPQFEGRERLSRVEAQQLGLSANRPHSAWVREALLYGQADGEAWVSARSVFPFVSLTGEARQLANLGTTPIGYVMFGRGGAVLDKRWFDKTEKGWQRTTLYDWQGRKLLISELFLAEFTKNILV